MSIEVLEALQEPIIAKLDTCSIANLADIVFAYSQVSLLNVKELNFKGLIERSILDRVTLKDFFNTLNATKILWALAKQANNKISPGFNQDVGSAILARNDIPKARSIDHIIPRLFCEQIIEEKKNSTPMNLSLILYSMASVDFHDQAFFEQAFLSFKQSPPAFNELGYLA